jgi:flagellar hook-basal body complex protein FliE
VEISNGAESLLSQIRDLQNKIETSKSPVGLDVTNDSEELSQPFSAQLGKAISGSISEVNNLQNIATESQNQFQMGGDIPLTEVVMKMQKASLAFEATVQVRNKILSAYQDVMNMPV